MRHAPRVSAFLRTIAAAALGLACVAVLAQSAPPEDARLVDAAKRGDAAAVKSLLDQGVSASAVDREGFPALAAAVTEGKNDVVRLLIAGGANASAVFKGTSMLFLADMSANEEARRLLFEAGARYSEKEVAFQAIRKAGFQPNKRGFFDALEKRRVDVVELMLRAGFGVNVDLFDGNTPLHVAARNGDLRTAELLVAKGADVNATNKRGTPVIGYAIVGKHEEMQRFLVSKGAKP